MTNQTNNNQIIFESIQSLKKAKEELRLKRESVNISKEAIAIAEQNLKEEQDYAKQVVEAMKVVAVNDSLTLQILNMTNDKDMAINRKQLPEYFQIEAKSDNYVRNP